jgi:short-subunit dehydrogenase
MDGQARVAVESIAVSGRSAAGKMAWITGASSGIGRALALRLARDGWTIAASARGSEALDVLAREAAGQIHAFPLDVTDRAAVVTTFLDIEAALGPVSLAVFGAGTYYRETVASFDAGKIGEMVNLNILGTANCLETVMRAMVARGSGHIGVMSSVAGYVGLPGAAGYGATKAALINMCEALYPELAAKGVRLSLVNPGFVDTPLTRKNDFAMPFIISAEEAADYIARGLAARRFEIVFPWKMALVFKLLRALPARLRFLLTRRMVRND